MADSPISTKLDSDVPAELRPLAAEWNAALSNTLDFIFSETGAITVKAETMDIFFDIILQCAAGVFAPAQYNRDGRKVVEKRFSRCLRSVTEQFRDDYNKSMGAGETRQ